MNLEIQPLLLMGLCELAAFALPGRGVGKFGRQAGQIQRDRLPDGGGRLDRHMLPCLAQPGAEFDDIGHDHRLAAGHDDVF